MKRTISAIIIAFAALLMVSCATANARKHLDAAKAYQQKGYLVEANKEYIRALKGITNRQKKAEYCHQVAKNYRKLKRFNDAVEYYKQAIEHYTFFSMPAPYEELAETYIAQDQPGYASAIVEEIDKPEITDRKAKQEKIYQLLGTYYIRKKEWRKAQLFYEKLLEMAKEEKNSDLSGKIKAKIDMLKKRAIQDRNRPKPDDEKKPEDSEKAPAPKDE